MSPRDVSIAEARNHLPRLVHEAEKGTPIRLTRRGKPVAVITSAEEYQRMTTPSGLWDALKAFRRAHDLKELDVDEVFAGLRDRSPGRRASW